MFSAAAIAPTTLNLGSSTSTPMNTHSSKSYPEEAAFCMLRGLGVESDEAQAISKMRLANPRIPDNGIVARLLVAQTPGA